MDIVKSIVDYWKRKNDGDQAIAPEHVCPNCWGDQEYDNVIRKMVEDKQIDVNAGRENYAFIREFVVKHVDGITLKNKIEGLECPRCESIGSQDKEG